MAGLTNEHRAGLLRELTNLGAGQAESESRHDAGRNFYPLPEHARALEPEVVLIVGDRGAGKSQLFGALTQPDLLEAILRRFPTARLPDPATGRVLWLAGYPLHAEGPNDAGWRGFVASREASPATVESLWFAHLVRVVRARLDGEARERLNALLQAPGGDPHACHAAFSECSTAALLALDRLDQQLQQRDEWIFVAYDELDTLVRFDWIAMGVLIRGLVAFWTSHARRWRRLRAKIFLRTDLFRRGTDIVGAEISKLAANRAELVWSDRHLYGMLLKRVLNRSEALTEYCRPALRGRMDLDPQLQHVPILQKIEEARPLIERLAGQHMGANESKGRTFTWILDHLRDGNKKATPRSLVRLLENAAQRELERPQAGGMRLLHHTSIRNALDRVSVAHVQEAETHELLWLPGVRARLKPLRLVPWERRDLERLLAADWDESWGVSDDVRPPATDARELVDYLIELGIVRLRPGPRGRPQRVDVPDVFLAGLDLKRKGGVRRK
jgi:hypothetical protein